MDGDPPTDTLLDTPERVMAGFRGQIFLTGNEGTADRGNTRVYEVDGGRIATVAGAGDSRFWPERDPLRDSSLDPDRICAELAAGPCDRERYHALAARIDVDGLAKTVAIGPRPEHWYSDPPPSECPLTPCDIAIDGAGGIYLADRDNAKVLRMHSDGSVTPLAGEQRERGGARVGCAIEVQLEDVAGITVAPDGNAYFVASKRVWKLDTTGAVRPFAGTGEAGFWGDGQQAKASSQNKVVIFCS